METKILTTSKNDIACASEIIKDGGLVAFPTETVYGLGANALNEQAVKNIFKAKGRPADNPLIVHISDVCQLKDLVLDIPKKAQILMDKFWPAPLTIVMRKSALVPEIVSAGLDTVAVRMPDHSVALDLIRSCNVPIAAPSANTSGKPSPTTAKYVIEDMNGRIDAVIDGGNCPVGVESTVIDVTTAVPSLLRPGAVTYEQLVEAIGDIRHNFEFKDGETPRSPGVKYKHYAPKCPVIIVRGDFDKFLNDNKDKYNKIGLLTTTGKVYPPNFVLKSLGATPNEYAANLFAHLREFDNEDVDVIFAQDIDSRGINLAVSNRLYKAAGYTFYEV